MQFDARTGKFKTDGGSTVRLSTMLRVIDQQQLATQRILMRYTAQLLSRQITLAQWEARIARAVSIAILQDSLIGSGGVNQFTDLHLEAIEQYQQQVLDALHQFAIAIGDQQQSPKQINARTRRYARAGRTAFHIARMVTFEQVVQHTEARRDLDPIAQHCQACIGHSTNGRWVPIDQVVPTGVDCDCGPNCKCRVITRGGRRPARLPQLGRDRIADLL